MNQIAFAQVNFLQVFENLPEPTRNFNPKTDIPPEWGTVIGNREGGKSKTIFLIQNAHAIPQAEWNTAQILRELSERYGVSKIAVEGTHRQFDPTFFRTYPDPSRLARLFQQITQTGEISGALWAAITTHAPLKIIGVEDWPLYERGVASYLKGLKDHPAILRHLDLLSSDLANLKKKYYSEEGRQLDLYLQDWEERGQGLLELLKFSSKIVPINQERYPSASAFLISIQSLELNDQNQIDGEVREWAKIIERGFRDSEIHRLLNEKKQAFRTQQITVSSYAYFLQSQLEKFPRVQKARIASRISPVLKRLIVAESSFAEALKSPVFMQELKSYLKEARGAVLKTQEEKQIQGLDEKILLLKKWIQFRLERTEWNDLSQFLMKNEGLAASGAQKDIRQLNEKISKLAADKSRFKAFRIFYETAVLREKVFLENTLRLFETGKNHPESVGLVVGGFHATSLVEELTKRDYSVVVIQPRIQDIPKEDQYARLMQGGVSWRPYMKARGGQIDLNEAFHRAMRDQLVNSEWRIVNSENKTSNTYPLSTNHYPLLKSWRDQIIRTLFEQGKVEEAGQYTRLIDEKVNERLSDETLAEYKNTWKKRLDQFIQELEKLDTHGELTENRILSLFTQPTNEHPYAIPIHTIPVSWLDSKEISLPIRIIPPRSEMRTDPPKIIRAEAGEIQPIGDWFHPNQITPESAKKAKGHFLQNINRVAKAKGLVFPKDPAKWNYDAILEDIGATRRTVEFWDGGEIDTATGQVEVPGVGWEYAVRILKLVSEERNIVKAAEKFLGAEGMGLTLNEMEAIFDQTTVEIEKLIKKPTRPLRRIKTSAEAQRALWRMIRNGFRIVDAIGMDSAKIIKKSGYEVQKEDYLRHGQWNQDGFESPGMSLDAALRFAELILGMKDNYQALARLMGDQNLNKEEIDKIFSLAKQGEKKISEPGTQVPTVEPEPIGDWFKREAITSDMAKKARVHFLKNIYRVAKAKGIVFPRNGKTYNYEIIAEDTGASLRTAGYWDKGERNSVTGQIEIPGISWIYAAKLLKLVSKEKNLVKAAEEFLGTKEISLKEIEKIFSKATSEIDALIKRPKGKNAFESIETAEEAKRARWRMMRNGFRIIDHLGMDAAKIVKDAGYGEETEYYLRYGKWNADGFEAPRMSLGRALKFSQLILGMANEWQAFARLMGEPSLSIPEIERIFKLAANGKIAAESESETGEKKTKNKEGVRPTKIDLKQVAARIENEEVSSIGILPSKENLVLVGTKSREILLYQPVLGTQGEIQSVELLDKIKIKGWIKIFGIFATGDLFTAGGTESLLRLIRINKKSGEYKLEKVEEYPVSGSVLSTAVSPDGTHLLVGNSENQVRLYRLVRNGSDQLEQLDHHHVGGKVLSLAFFDKGNHAVVASDDGKLRHYQVVTNEEGKRSLLYQNVYDIPGGGEKIATFPDGRHVLVTNGSRDYWIYTLETAKEGNLLKEVSHGQVESDVLSLQIHPDGREVSIGSTDGSYRVYQVAYLEKKVPASLNLAASADGGNWIASIGVFPDAGHTVLGAGSREHRWFQIHRSELRKETPAATWLSNLDQVNWSEMSQEYKKALVRYFLNDVIRKTPNELLADPNAERILKETRFLNDQTLRSFYEHCERIRRERKYPFSAAALLLYQAGYKGFEGYDEIEAREFIETKISIKARKIFNEIASEIEIEKWMHLFWNNEAGLLMLLWGLIEDRYPKQEGQDGIKGAEIMVLLSQRWSEYAESLDLKGSDPHFSLDDLQKMEKVLGKMWKPKNQHLLLTQIHTRIGLDLEQRARPFVKADKSLAGGAIQVASSWFGQRLRSLTGQEEMPLNKIYESLNEVYTDLLKSRFQGGNSYLPLLSSWRKNPKTGAKEGRQWLHLAQHLVIHFGVKNYEQGKRGILIADEMGVGKSVEILGILKMLAEKKKKQKSGILRTVLVASKEVLANWQDNEIPRWFGSDYTKQKVAVITAASRAGDKTPREQYQKALENGAEIILINYELLRIAEGIEAEDDQDARDLIGLINRSKIDIKIADEAHRLRSPETQESRGWRQMKAGFVIHSTGTPVWNQLTDIVPLLHEIDPVRYPYPNPKAYKALPTAQQSDIIRQICIKAVNGNGKHRDNELDHLRFNHELWESGLYIRRRLEDVLPLAAHLKTRELETLKVKLWPSQWELYEKIKEEDGADKDRQDQFYRLRMAALDPEIEKPKPEWSPVAPPKHQVVADLVQKILAQDPDGKIVIYGEHNRGIDRLEMVLAAQMGQKPIASMRSSMDDDKRKNQIKAFQTQKEKRVFITSRIGGEGINLTAAKYVIFFELPWTSTGLDQRIRRVQRQGQEEQVKIFVLLAEGTVEERVWQIINEKDGRFNRSVNGLIGELNNNPLWLAYIEQKLSEDLSKHDSRKLLGGIQGAYVITTSGDNKGGIPKWTSISGQYSEHLEELAAFPIAQLLFRDFVEWYQKEMQGKASIFKKGFAMFSGPWGPASNERAIHSIRDWVLEKTGMDVDQDVDFVGDDYTPEMRQLGTEEMEELGMKKPTVYSQDMTEDELPRSEFADLADSSEYRAYRHHENPQGVSQVNWMLAQLVKSVKKDGYVQLWTHSGIINELGEGGAAWAYLAKYGLEVVSYGNLNLSNIKDRELHETLKDFSYVRCRRVDPNVPIFNRTPEGVQMVNMDELKKLNGQGLEIESRDHSFILRKVNKERKISLDPSQRKSKDLSDYFRGGQLIHSPSQPEDPNKAEMELERLKTELEDQLKSLPTLENYRDRAKQIHDGVMQLIRMRLASAVLRDIREMLVSQLARTSTDLDPARQGLNRSIQNDSLREIEAELREAEKEEKIGELLSIVDKKPDPKPDGTKGPGEPRHGYPVEDRILQQSPLLTALREKISFLESEEHLDFRVEETKPGQAVAWVPSKWVLQLDENDLVRVLELRALLHLDSFFPDHRRETLDAVLSFFQNRLDSNSLYPIAGRLPLSKDPFIFSRLLRFLLHTADRAALARDPQEFIYLWRNNSAALPLENTQDPVAARQITAFIEKAFGFESQEEKKAPGFPQFAGRYTPQKMVAAKIGHSRLGRIPVKRIPIVSMDHFRNGHSHLLTSSDPTKAGFAPYLLRSVEQGKIGVFKLDTNLYLPLESATPETVIDLNSVGASFQVGPVTFQIKDPENLVLDWQSIPAGEARLMSADFTQLEQVSQERTELRIFYALSGIDGGRDSIVQAARSTVAMSQQLGLPALSSRLTQAYEDLISNPSDFYEAIARQNAERSLSVYRQVLDQGRKSGLSVTEINARAHQAFQRTLERLVHSIEMGETQNLAPVLFYSPEEKDLIRIFVESLYRAVEKRSAFDSDDLKIHLLAQVRMPEEKRDWMNFITSIPVQVRTAIQFYSFDGSLSSTTALSRTLKSQAMKNSKSSAIIFPPQEWLDIIPASTSDAVVLRPEQLPYLYALAALPELVLYFSKESRGNISSGTAFEFINANKEGKVEISSDIADRILQNRSELRSFDQAEELVEAADTTPESQWTTALNLLNRAKALYETVVQAFQTETEKEAARLNLLRLQSREKALKFQAALARPETPVQEPSIVVKLNVSEGEDLIFEEQQFLEVFHALHQYKKQQWQTWISQSSEPVSEEVNLRPSLEEMVSLLNAWTSESTWDLEKVQIVLALINSRLDSTAPPYSLGESGLPGKPDLKIDIDWVKSAYLQEGNEDFSLISIVLHQNSKEEETHSPVSNGSESPSVHSENAGDQVSGKNEKRDGTADKPPAPNGKSSETILLEKINRGAKSLKEYLAETDFAVGVQWETYLADLKTFILDQGDNGNVYNRILKSLDLREGDLQTAWQYWNYRTQNGFREPQFDAFFQTTKAPDFDKSKFLKSLERLNAILPSPMFTTDKNPLIAENNQILKITPDFYDLLGMNDLNFSNFPPTSGNLNRAYDIRQGESRKRNEALVYARNFLDRPANGNVFPRLESVTISYQNGRQHQTKVDLAGYQRFYQFMLVSRARGELRGLVEANQLYQQGLTLKDSTPQEALLKFQAALAEYEALTSGPIKRLAEMNLVRAKQQITSVENKMKEDVKNQQTYEFAVILAAAFHSTPSIKQFLEPAAKHFGISPDDLQKLTQLAEQVSEILKQPPNSDRLNPEDLSLLDTLVKRGFLIIQNASTLVSPEISEKANELMDQIPELKQRRLDRWAVSAVLAVNADPKTGLETPLSEELELLDVPSKDRPQIIPVALRIWDLSHNSLRMLEPEDIDFRNYLSTLGLELDLEQGRHQQREAGSNKFIAFTPWTLQVPSAQGGHESLPRTEIRQVEKSAPQTSLDAGKFIADLRSAEQVMTSFLRIRNIEDETMVHQLLESIESLKAWDSKSQLRFVLVAEDQEVERVLRRKVQDWFSRNGNPEKNQIENVKIISAQNSLSSSVVPLGTASVWVDWLSGNARFERPINETAEKRVWADQLFNGERLTFDEKNQGYALSVLQAVELLLHGTSASSLIPLNGNGPYVQSSTSGFWRFSQLWAELQRISTSA